MMNCVSFRDVLFFNNSNLYFRLYSNSIRQPISIDEQMFLDLHVSGRISLWLSYPQPYWKTCSTDRVEELTLITITTWLILPVVIRLSQRLSHACLSINLILWSCERLIISVIVYLIVPYYLDNRSNSRANTCWNTHWVVFIRLKPILIGTVVIHTKIADRSCDGSFKFLPYQLWMVRYWLTMALTGNGELGFDSGEGAWEMATTSKEGSRRVNYPILKQGGSDNK